MNIYTDNNNDTVYDLTYKGSYYTQKNNKVDPYCTCATTSMIQALDLCGYMNSFPKGKYTQAEDNLTYFLRTDSRVLDYYRETDPYSYKNWKENPQSKNVYQPNEIHAVLNYGTNLWMNKKITEFTTKFSINDIPNEIINRQKPLVMSGVFHKLNHIITCVGVIIKESSAHKNKKNLGFFDCKGFLFDDPFGYTWDYSKNRNGEKIEFTPNQIILLLKSKDNPTEKWVHYFI